MNQTKQQIEDEYDKIVETASAKYDKITDLALAENKEREFAGYAADEIKK